ncbi:MAG: PIN domain-containing protein [Sphingomonadaceae bacterium]
MAQTSIDTNIFVYAAGLKKIEADEAKIVKAGHLIADLALAGRLSVAAQVFAELHNVLIKKLRLNRVEASAIVAEYIDASIVVPTTGALLADTFDLSTRHNLQTYDAIILSATAQSRCNILYSEDMQHGFVWRGVEVVNPFVS